MGLLPIPSHLAGGRPPTPPIYLERFTRSASLILARLDVKEEEGQRALPGTNGLHPEGPLALVTANIAS